MKKKILLIILAAVLLLTILFIPIPNGFYKDGGTRTYTALTYKIVKWNRITDEDVFRETRVYWFPNNFRSIDDLWAEEEPEALNTLTALVLELNNDIALVQPLEGEQEASSSDQISFGFHKLENIDVKVGSTVEIRYRGGIMETYPAKIHAVSWKLLSDPVYTAYTGQWLDPETTEKVENWNNSEDLIISEIYSDCFMAYPVIPMPHTYKINGAISEKWCVGDQVLVTFENIYADDTSRMEADLVDIETSTFEIDPNACYKPVIYLYPEEETPVSVMLQLQGELTCTYPAYNDGWNVTAAPDGTLTDANGQTYNYLYWEGETTAQWDMTQGFCVKGEETAAFLEWALAELGLTRREANEFIVYWLPLMEQNPYNIISFQGTAYTDAAQLQVTPAPETTIRVFMTWKATDSFQELTPQELTAPERTGFTLVEWGGTEIQ